MNSMLPTQQVTRSNPACIALINHLIQVAETIAAAHRQKVLHRDLKPLNAVIDEDDGKAVLLDWGLALRTGTTDESAEQNSETDAHDKLTQDGSGVGTIVYMSPEQASGEVQSYNEQTDVYGLGAIMFEILSGAPPHSSQILKADSSADRMAQIAGGTSSDASNG